MTMSNTHPQFYINNIMLLALLTFTFLLRNAYRAATVTRLTV